MNNQNWQEIMEKLSNAWVTSPMGSFSEMLPNEPIKPTWKTKLASVLYHTVYFITYYPLRWAYLTWDAIEDAFNDAWERWD
jgi:hypothetical protein